MRRKRQRSIWDGFGQSVAVPTEPKEELNDWKPSDRKIQCPKCGQNCARSIVTTTTMTEEVQEFICGGCGTVVDVKRRFL